MTLKSKIHKDKKEGNYNKDEGYYNIVYRGGIYLERHLNGSFTISDNKGNKMTYYGYSRKDALNKFKRERKIR